jgi:hypothetical protein
MGSFYARRPAKAIANYQSLTPTCAGGKGKNKQIIKA